MERSGDEIWSVIERHCQRMFGLRLVRKEGRHRGDSHWLPLGDWGLRLFSHLSNEKSLIGDALLKRRNVMKDGYDYSVRHG